MCGTSGGRATAVAATLRVVTVLVAVANADGSSSHIYIGAEKRLVESSDRLL